MGGGALGQRRGAGRENNRIRKITPAGVVTTVAGSGAAGGRNAFAEPLTNAEFNQPNGIALGFDGRLFVADTFNGRLRQIVFSW